VAEQPVTDSYVQVLPDGAGKKVEATPVTIPAGTVITASDGSTTTLSADATYFRQVVALGGSDFGALARVSGEADRGHLIVSGDALAHLEAIHETLVEIRTLLTMALEG
jgi:hypothetical protein